MLISARDIISQTMDMYKRHWRSLVPYLVALFLSLFLLELTAYFYENSIILLSTPVGVTTFFILGMMFVIGQIASLLIGVAMIRALAMAFMGKAIPPAKKMYGDAVHLLVPALIASIVAGLLAIIGFMAFIVPGIVLFVWFAFALHAVSIDGQPGIHSLKISRALSKGKFFAMLWRLFAPGVIFGLFFVIPKEIIDAVFEAIPRMMETVTEGNLLFMSMIALVIQLAIVVAVSPLTSGAVTLLYLDAKKKI